MCLQGSPNLSTPALLEAFPVGNIELANLLVGESGQFDHLVSDLVLSPEPVDVADLGLGLTDDDDTEDVALHRRVRELAWVPPRLSGVFDRIVIEPPALLVGDSTVDDVTWELHDAIDDTTRFTAILGEDASGRLGRVEAVTFIFDTGDLSAPVYPYHLNTLIALASGQGRTDLSSSRRLRPGRRRIGAALAQLDEVLVVDGHSIWRMLKRNVPQPAPDDETSAFSYGDLDWEAIQSHPKLAQYRMGPARVHRPHGARHPPWLHRRAIPRRCRTATFGGERYRRPPARRRSARRSRCHSRGRRRGGGGG